MTKYKLAKIISLARNGTVESRKRVQKIVYLLQAAGMELASDFRLHLFGPYSRHVASLLDEMTSAEILEEVERPLRHGVQFDYVITDTAKAAIEELEEKDSKAIKGQFEEIVRFRSKIDTLMQVDDVWLLELGSTMAYFHQNGYDWQDAANRACDFKKVETDATRSQLALALAMKVVD